MYARALALVAAAAALSLAVVASAGGSVGVEKVSDRAGAPGRSVTLTVGCGFCFPPCVGPKGERHPKGFDHGPCMLGTKADPPAWFGIFLAPRSHRGSLTFLGRAVPPPGGNNPEGGDPPRYLLTFTIPDLRPGKYTYEIRSTPGPHAKRGVMVKDPGSPLWTLTVRGRR
jgi:hypothetical protein